MAQRTVAIIAALAVAGLTLGPVTAVIFRATDWPALGPADWQALRFTLLQSVLSAGFSVALALPVSRALARRRFPGRGALVALLGAPFILPVIVAVLGLLAVFGNSGLLNSLLALVGLPKVTIYGLHGVVLAHVFFNLPLATRLLLQGWLAIPGERFRLSASLGLSPGAVFRTLEWPMLRSIAPGAFAVIFVICLSSFAIALTLGGGPKSTTVELAIYQSVRFDFDLGRAAMLSVIQMGLALTAGIAALRLSGNAGGFGNGLDRVITRWDVQTKWLRVADTVWILLAALFLLTPLTMILARGVGDIPNLGLPIWRSALHSVTVALGSTALCMIWAVALANRWGELVGLLPIALSSLVLGTGLFLIVRPFANPFDLALPVTALVNALVSLPFALRILRPEAQTIRQDYARLSQSLNLTGWAWLRWVFLPRLRRPIGFAAGLTAALSMGDLGVIALFSDPENATLPLQVYRLMGAYRMDEAAGAAVVLLLLSLGFFWIFDRGGRVGSSS